MKLLRYGPLGQEKPGLLDDAGNMRDLSCVFDELTPARLSPECIRALSALSAEALPLVEGKPRIGAPIPTPRQFIAIGLNYSDHATEAGLPPPDEPVVLLKSSACIAGPDDDVVMPTGASKVDYEIELGIVIGLRGRNIAKEDARSHIAGYVIANDVSERAFQLERGGTWDKGKSYPGFGPIGPWLVTADAIDDPQALRMELRVNGAIRQSGSTANMIFGISEIVSYVSMFFELSPGDLIITGTPAGVGLGAGNYIRAGDQVELEIEGLGVQRHTFL